VFVADSAPSKMQENVESLRNLEENLNEHGLTLDTIPWVIQYNKRDLPDALPVPVLQSKLNLLNVPSYEAIATTGDGIYETFQAIAGLLYGQLSERLKRVQPGARGMQTEESPRTHRPSPPRPAAPARQAPTAQRSTQDHDPSHDNPSDVIDVALREVSPTPSQRRAAAPARQEPAKPAPRRPVSPPRSSHVGSTDESLDEEFQFAALEEENMQDDDIGRVIDFDNTQTLERTPDEESNGEFIVDPFHTGKGEGAPPKRPAAPPPSPPADRGTHAAPSIGTQDEVAITVPVVLTRSQMRKTIPVKVTLEIQWVDEEM